MTTFNAKRLTLLLSAVCLMFAIAPSVFAGDAVAPSSELTATSYREPDASTNIKAGSVTMYRNIKYKNLTARQKVIYNALLKAYRSSTKTKKVVKFYNSANNSNDFWRAKYAFNNQLMRYSLGLVTEKQVFKWTNTRTGRFVYWTWTINPSKTRTRMDNHKKNLAKLKSISKKILKGKSTTRQKVIAINNYVCNKLTYSKNLGSLHNALNGKYTKCTGYTCLFKALCEVSGIDCWMVFGYAGEGHAWNQVKIGGKWYYVDPTWNDSVPKNKYLLKSGLWRDHSRVYAKLDVTNFHQYGEYI